MLFHEAIGRALMDNGVRVVFGLIGDGNLYMMHSFVSTLGGEYYSVAHEATGVLAANAYARATGGVGVATVTHGPALTNTVTALIESVKERTPLVLIAGDTVVSDKEHLQNVDQNALILPTGAGFERVRSSQSVFEDVSVAVRRALAERRPIVLNVPSEFQWHDIEYTANSGSRWVPPQRVSPAREALEGAVGAIAASRRPVVLAGRGAQEREARDALIALAERIGAPVATTLRGRDLFAGHPHNLGICGTLSHEIALETLSQADCIIAFGASLNKWTSAEGAIFQGKALIHVDNDDVALGLYESIDFGIVGDSGAAANAIAAMLDQLETKPTTYASQSLAERLASRDAADFEDLSTDTTVDHRTAIIALDQAFPKERALVLDAGRVIWNCLRALHVQRPSQYFHTLNFGSIGLGMGNAIGAAVGTRLPTLVVMGDGGFMLGGLVEFNTAVRHQLDIVVVVLNDGAYGAEHIQFRNRELSTSLSEFNWPDFASVATSLGGESYTVRNLEELSQVMSQLPRRSRPVLIDVRLDPDRVRTGDH